MLVYGTVATIEVSGGLGFLVWNCCWNSIEDHGMPFVESWTLQRNYPSLHFLRRAHRIQPQIHLHLLFLLDILVPFV